MAAIVRASSAVSVAAASVLWALAKWSKAPVWALVLTLILGVVLSGTILGPDIHKIMSQLSGGRLN